MINNSFDSRDEIFAFLARQVDPEELPKLRLDFSYLTPTELVHIDVLIFLMSQYKFAAEYFQQAIFEIILEHEREYEALMKNFTWFNELHTSLAHDATSLLQSWLIADVSSIISFKIKQTK